MTSAKTEVKNCIKPIKNANVGAWKTYGWLLTYFISIIPFSTSWDNSRCNAIELANLTNCNL